MYDLSHDRWSDQLPYYVAGTLPESDRAALKRHLATCADCRADLLEWEYIAAAVRAAAASRVERRALPMLKGPFVAARNGKSWPLSPEQPLVAPFPVQGWRSLLHRERGSRARDHGPSPSSIMDGEGQPEVEDRGGEAVLTWLVKPDSIERTKPVTTSPIAYPAPVSRRRVPSITLAAALLLIVLFGGALLAINLRDNPESSVIPAGIAAATRTPAPTIPTMTVTPTSPPDSGPAGPTLPESVKLDGISFEFQSWNNQGPANLAMALSYWGWEGNQYDTAAWLKPDSEDKSVAPWQMAYYTNTFTDFRAIYRMGGTVDLLKHLLAADFPVIVRQSIQPEGEDWMGHYVLLMGYDEENQQFLTYDSYFGSNEDAGRPSPYSTFDERWRHFNRMFIVVYDPAREDDLRDVLGDYVDPVVGAEQALEATHAEMDQDKEDAWAWFNLGTSFVALEQYRDAATAYDQAINLGLPWRILWYQFGPYEAYFNVGDYSSVLALAESTLATTRYVEETYYWQLMVYLTDPSQSATDIERPFSNLLLHNRNFLLAWIDPLLLAAEADHLPVGWEADAGVLFGRIDAPPEPAPEPIEIPIPTLTLTHVTATPAD